MNSQNSSSATETSLKQIALIGAGHTHLEVVRQWGKRPIPQASLTLVSAFDQATYSGMLPGTLAGLYTPEQMRIDLHKLTEQCGVELRVAAAENIDVASRTVTLQDGHTLNFDIASIGIGSVPALGSLWKNHDQVLSIKPMQTFRERLLARLQEHTSPAEIVIIGAGAAGVEVCLCLHQFLEREQESLKAQHRVSLCDAGSTILSGYRQGTIKRAERELQRLEIPVHLGKRATRYLSDETALQFEEESQLTADLVICAVGATAPELLSRVDLPHDDRGFLAVQPTLLTTGEAPVFAVGDTASIVDHPVAKAGVYAVREAPILWDNLNRLVADEDLKPYRPQSGFLSLLATGNGLAILDYKGFACHTRWAWWLKNFIDRRFMKKYQK